MEGPGRIKKLFVYIHRKATEKSRLFDIKMDFPSFFFTPKMESFVMEILKKKFIKLFLKNCKFEVVDLISF